MGVTDTATRVASLDTEGLVALHKSLDVLDPADPAAVEAHHLVTVEMARRGVPHGHDGDPWAAAAIVVDEVQVDSPTQIEAPAGLEKAWETALADGGTVSVLLTADGYVLKADPGVNAVHTDTIMGDDEDEDDEPVAKAWDDPDHLAGLTSDDRRWFATVATVLDSGGDPDLIVEKGNPEPLREYWRAGGKGQIQWGAGGDFTACAAAVSRYMSVEEAKGYCAIRHRETTGMWPGDRRNRVAKAKVEEYATTVTLPDGTRIVAQPVEKHGSHDQSTHGRHGGGGTSTAEAAAPSTGGSTSIPRDLKRRVRSELGRGAQVEAYSAGVEAGRIAATAGKDQAARMVASRVARRDAQAAQLEKAPPRSHLSEGLAFSIVGDQGFIDGATGTRSGFPRTHSFGETLAGVMFGGLSGATKSVEPVEKHGNHDQSTHGRKGSAPRLMRQPDNPPADPSKHSPASIAAARAVRAKAAAAEPEITMAMDRLADAHGGVLEGLDFRLKSEKSLTRKVDDEKDEPKNGGDPVKTAEGMSDVVRYTMTFTDSEYVEGTKSALKDLQQQGYETRVKNYWKKGDPYQGINVAVTDPRTGLTFEVQFHTPTSLDFKEPLLVQRRPRAAPLTENDPFSRTGTHEVYDRARTSTSTRVKWKAYRTMTRYVEHIPVPPPPDGLMSIGTVLTQPFRDASGRAYEIS